ncbi:MAG: HAMP domain-containing protein [bacterium]
MSLRLKVTLLLLLLSLTPVLLAGFVQVHRAKEQGKSSEKAHYILAATAAARAIDQLAERAFAEALLLARRFPAAEVDLVGAANQLAAGGPAPPVLGAWEAASLVHDLNDAEQTVFLSLPDGRLAYTVPYRNVAGLNIRDSAWFGRLPPEGGVVAGRLEHLSSTRLFALIAVAPITGPRGLVGHVGVMVHAPRLAELVQQAGRDIRGSVDVFDPSGELVTTGEGRSATPHRHDRLVSTDPPPSAETLDLDDGEWLAAWAPVQAVPLTVQIRVPAAQAYRHVYVLIWLLTGVIVLTFCFVVLFSDFLATFLLRPIHDLERGADMIGAGMLDYRIEVTSHAHDELGRLASAFNRMGERLHGSQKEVRAYSRSLETANEELDALVYGITHDLKKSLRNIEAFATFLQEDYGEALGPEGSAWPTPSTRPPSASTSSPTI